MTVNAAFRGRRLAAPAALALAALCWCAAVVAPALMMSSGRDAGAAAIRAAFSVACHQDPARSFALAGSPLAVCVRCSAIYAGFTLGCLAVLARRFTGGALAAPPGRLLAAGIAPTAIEWLAESAGMVDSMELARTATGVLFGFAAAFFVVPAFEELPAEMAREFRRLISPARSAHGKAS